jgi:nitrogen fixation NifU-like protein
MDRQSRIDFILDHYENPRRYGALADADAVAKGVNPGCGDVVTIYLKAGRDGRIADIAFEGEGCTISVAAASVVVEMFAGKTLAEVEATPADAILELIGREIAATRLKCATLGLNAAKEAVQRLRNLGREHGQGADHHDPTDPARGYRLFPKRQMPAAEMPGVWEQIEQDIVQEMPDLLTMSAEEQQADFDRLSGIIAQNMPYRTLEEFEQAQNVIP